MDRYEAALKRVDFCFFTRDTLQWNQESTNASAAVSPGTGPANSPLCCMTWQHSLAYGWIDRRERGQAYKSNSQYALRISAGSIRVCVTSPWVIRQHLPILVTLGLRHVCTCTCSFPGSGIARNVHQTSNSLVREKLLFLGPLRQTRYKLSSELSEPSRLRRFLIFVEDIPRLSIANPNILEHYE